MAHLELLLFPERQFHDDNNCWSSVIKELAKEEYKYHSALGKLTVLKYKYVGHQRGYSYSTKKSKKSINNVISPLPKISTSRNQFNTNLGLNTFTNPNSQKSLVLPKRKVNQLFSQIRKKLRSKKPPALENFLKRSTSERQKGFRRIV